MPESARPKRLKKELRLLDVYAIATGATLSAGLFLLPGIAAAEAGPALVLAYMLAALPLILKVAFALIGMGAYISLFVPNLPNMPVAMATA